jgi:hypothetical protein
LNGGRYKDKKSHFKISVKTPRKSMGRGWEDVLIAPVKTRKIPVLTSIKPSICKKQYRTGTYYPVVILAGAIIL